jgi:hypothetical protein
MTWRIHAWSPATGRGSIASDHAGPLLFDVNANVRQVADFLVGEPVDATRMAGIKCWVHRRGKPDAFGTDRAEARTRAGMGQSPPDVDSVALIDSHARGSPAPECDVDLNGLVPEPAHYASQHDGSFGFTTPRGASRVNVGCWPTRWITWERCFPPVDSVGTARHRAVATRRCECC